MALMIKKPPPLSEILTKAVTSAMIKPRMKEMRARVMVYLKPAAKICGR